MRLRLISVDVIGTHDEVAEAVETIVAQLCGRPVSDAMSEQPAAIPTAPASGEAAQESAALPAGQEQHASPLCESQAPAAGNPPRPAGETAGKTTADAGGDPPSPRAATPRDTPPSATPARPGPASSLMYELMRATGNRVLMIEELMAATGLTRQAIHNAVHAQKEAGWEWAKAKGYKFRKAAQADIGEAKPRHSLSESMPLNPNVIGGGARIPQPRDPEPIHPAA